ncbi:MAG: lipopolysaccharide heptosyltransferase II [Candidatus Omnitrophota bacterium]
MKKILIINVNWLGDVIFSTPAIKALRNKETDAHIACLVISHTEEVLKNNPRINEIIVYDEYGKHRTFLAKIKFIRYLRKKRFNQVYILHPSLRRAMIGFLAGIPERIGYGTKKRSFLLTKSIEIPDKLMHKIDYFLNLFEACGVSRVDRECEFFINDAGKKNARDILNASGINSSEKFVVMNAGGNWMLKRWDPENFARLADMLIEEKKVKIVFAGAKRDQDLTKQIVNLMKNKCSIITGQTDLHELAAIMQYACCVVSADSGPLHIAAASGVNAVAIFGPTSAELTGPVGSGKVIILKKEVNCSIPCYETVCENRRCMNSIKPRDVFNSVINFIN